MTNDEDRMLDLLAVKKYLISRRSNCHADAALASLFPDKVDRHAPAVRLETMFPQINPLPGPECQPPILDWNAQIHRRQGRADMRRHIVVAFARMLEQRVPIRGEPREKPLQIPAHLWIGILLDQKRRRRVLQKQ